MIRFCEGCGKYLSPTNQTHYRLGLCPECLQEKKIRGADPELKEGKMLEGPYWPERVKVISVKKVGSNIEIQAVGVETNRFYQGILREVDLQNVRVLDHRIKDFSGNAESLFLALEAKRIRFAHQFDPFCAVNVSQIDPLPHQIEGVYYYILKQPRIRFLLADDPGAGKTIMAGLVLKELKQRGIIERTLIVVPSHLINQWRRELKEKFGETFRVVDRAVMNASWGRHVWQDDSQLITSMDFAKQEEVMQSMVDVKWDLVIVDEAHNMAAYRYGQNLVKTQRYKLGELLSRNSDFLLLITATPHRGDPENFRLLLDLLEPGFFATTYMLEESIRNRDNLSPLFLRRLKEDLRNFDRKPLFPPRHTITIRYYLNDDEKRLYNAVTEYVEKYYRKAIDKDRRSVAFALIILQRRLASSVRAIRRSLERRIKRLRELSEKMEKGEIPKEPRYIYEELEDESEAERWRIEDELSEMLTTAETIYELREELDKLEELVRLAYEAEKREIETKLNELRKVIESERLKQTEEKLLIFTEFRDTLEYLVEKLKSWGFSVCYIHGSQQLDERIAAETEFNQTATQIMVSTEAGGAGINLQFRCWLMVNYDIPWNPNRLEQRMGRLHRYLQQNEVHIYNLVSTDTREGKILSTLFDKLKIISKQLGSDRVYDVIGEVILGRSLQDLILEAVTNKRSMEDILRDFDRITNEESIRRLKEVMVEGLAIKHVDLTRVIGEMRIAKENRLVPEYIEKFFMKAANKLGLKIEQRSDGLYRIQNVPYEIRKVSYKFKLRYGEPYREYSRFSFVKDEAVRKQAEFIAPGHPLLEALVEKISENYRTDLEKGATFIDPSGRLDGLLWFIESEINDGNGDVVGKKIFVLYQSINEIRPVSPSILWDLKSDGTHVPERFLELASREDDIISYTTDTILPPYLEELKERRKQDAEVKRRYGISSIEHLISESEDKLRSYEYRKAHGEDMDIAIQSERKRKEDLIRRREQLEKQIQAETHLLLSPPKIIGVAAVLPKAPTDDVLEESEEIEKIGMDIAMKFELAQGRSPENVSAQNLGFDIRSRASDESFRYIEVKTRAMEGKIALTPNEWLMAHRLGDEYWLYVVTNVDTAPELYTIQNPAEKLKPEEEVEVVRYIVTEWKSAATKEIVGG